MVSKKIRLHEANGCALTLHPGHNMQFSNSCYSSMWSLLSVLDYTREFVFSIFTNSEYNNVQSLGHFIIEFSPNG